MKPSIAFDTQTVRYLVDAWKVGYNPDEDQNAKLRPERIASLRILIYHGLIYALPTVQREARRIKLDLVLREEKESTLDRLFENVAVSDDAACARATEHYEFHHAARAFYDCLVVAEAELAEMDILVTFDDDVLKYLSGRTGALRLMTASCCWQFLNIPHGAEPAICPRPTNPLAHTDWWRW